MTKITGTVEGKWDINIMRPTAGSNKSDIPKPPKSCCEDSFTPTPSELVFDPVYSTKRIISLWGMLEFDPKSILSALSFLGSTAGEFKLLATLLSRSNIVAARTLEQKAHILKSIETVMNASNDFGLKTSAIVAKQSFGTALELLSPDRPFNSTQANQLVTAIEGLLNTFVAEATARKFFAMPDGAADYHVKADHSFGEKVVDTFPDAEFDIDEAGKCISFGLWTASVMHTMRVLEIGLRGLSEHLGIDPKQNWNQTLNTMESELGKIRKREHGSDAEQWAAEAGTHFRFVKNAWRNNSMHPDSNYDEKQAKNIFNNSRTFMQHLADKLGS